MSMLNITHVAFKQQGLRQWYWRLEGFNRGLNAAVVIAVHFLLRCAKHINKNKQALMGEPQGCLWNEQTIRMLIVPNNVTLNSIAQRHTQRTEEKERECVGKLSYTDYRGLETLDADIWAGRDWVNLWISYFIIPLQPQNIHWPSCG